MSRKNKRITKDLIKNHFGKQARVSGGLGRYRVTTPTGGEVIITDSKIKLVCGGDDVYRAVVTLAGDVWAHPKVSGSREFMLGAVAHGEAWGVPVVPNYNDKNATFSRWLVALIILASGYFLDLFQDPTLALGTLAVAWLIFAMMRRTAKKKEAAKFEADGFHYPRIQGSARFADDEDLEKGGLI